MPIHRTCWVRLRLCPDPAAARALRAACWPLLALGLLGLRIGPARADQGQRGGDGAAGGVAEGAAGGVEIAGQPAPRGLAPDGGSLSSSDAPEVIIPVVRAGPSRAPAAASTVIETDRFAGEARTVAELLGTAPGVTLHATGGPGQAATLSLRGASPEQSLVLLDGIPLQGPGGGSIDLGELPASLLSRLVVTRGVLGAQLGAGALGGAVELVPRSPDAQARQLGAELSAGSFGTARLAVDAAGPAGAGGWTAGVQLDRTSGDYSYAWQPTPEARNSPYALAGRVNADARRAALLLRGEARPAQDLTVDLLLQGSAGDRGLPGPVGSGTEHARAEDRGGLIGLRARGLAGDAGQLIWTARAWGRVDRVRVSGLGAGFNDCTSGAPGCPDSDSRSSTARGEGEVSFPLGSSQLFTARASGGQEWIAGSDTGGHRRGLGSLALSDELRLLSGSLAFYPALRLDQVGGETALSPGLGATWRPFSSRAEAALRALELRAGAGRSFRPPGFSELYLEQGAVAHNPALVPERATSLDLGLSWQGERLSLAASVFSSWYQQLIIYEAYPPARVKPFNIGRARIAGGELQAVLQLSWGVTAEAAYTLLDAVDLRDSATEYGQKLPYRPPHRLFLRTARRGDRVEGFLELAATSSMPRNQFGTADLPGQLVLNAGAGVRAAGPLWLDLEVRNLLDDRTRQDLFQYPLPGVSVTALARARF